MIHNKSLTPLKITKQQVYKSAIEYISIGLIPTQKLIKQKLGKGSNTTINKYLKQWLQESLKKGNNLQEFNNYNDVNNIVEEKRNLSQDLKKQITRNEEYTQELIQAEKTIVALKEENQQLNTTNHKLQIELQKVIAIKVTLTQVNQEIQSRLELNESNSITQQQQCIESLQTELKELNAKSMKAMQELSSSGHEILMQEKVHSINLQAKNRQLMKELAESHKQLESMKLRSEFQVKVLQRQIKAQQQALKNYLPPEELNNLSMEEVLTGVSCGK